MAIGMAVLGALASLVRSRSGGTPTGGDFVAHEAEVSAELADASPLAPATRIAEPLDQPARD